MKIVEYTIATGLDSEEIADEVRGLIGEGWQPLGGVCHTQVRPQQQEDADWYCQAMVKYAPEEKQLQNLDRNTGSWHSSNQ